MVNCESLDTIQKDCSNALGGINQRIYINDSKNVDYDDANITGHTIDTLSIASGGTEFETIQFRKNLATLTEEYEENPDGAVMFNQSLMIPIHGRDASKSKKISVMAAGQRELDIIIPQNDGGYVYLRQAVLSSVADGTNAAKADGSKYTLTFTSESEELAYFVDEALLDTLIAPIVP